ncbi:MAG: hypothetical protein H6625_04340 [Bdellovibrionaceae bacterium]|nr:hypothetical protein [Pseudobdellovibrionaceae bacterium]
MRNKTTSKKQARNWICSGYMWLLVYTFICLVTCPTHQAQAQEYVRGFNLIESDSFLFDAQDKSKSDAQIAVDEAKALGANHIILNVRATMTGPYSNELVPVTAPAERGPEKKRMAKLIRYIRSQNMTIGLRPIFFVVGPNGEFPYNEERQDGSLKNWWHGNIQPQDPNRWFESFKVYLDVYLPLAALLKVEEFTIAAELYSMTVGLEDQWKKHPYGFPGRWLQLLRYVKSKLPSSRLMYDINFTDDKVSSNGFGVTGGELERWRYRIVDLADRSDPKEKEIWNDLVTFWSELDAIGIDVYRSLASPKQNLPKESLELVRTLKLRTDSFATQMDNIFSEISIVLGVDKEVIFKEIGFRSVEKGFIDPFAYAGSGDVKIQHQAAAFQAYFESFWEPQWPWFKGFNFWEISLNPTRKGELDKGFSPVGKKETEDVILKYFK